MAIPGRPPTAAAAGQQRHRNAAAFDWTEVPDVPFEGPSPDLPENGFVWREKSKEGDVVHCDEWPAQTVEWWERVRRLPHAVLWRDEDWQAALSAAVTHAHYWTGTPGLGKQLAALESRLGLTREDRMRQRIRYTEAKAPTAKASKASDPRARLRAVNGGS